MGWLQVSESGQSALAAAASWSVTFWVHSTLIIGAVWVVAALVRASAEARDVAWKWALCLPFATASVHLFWPERPFAPRFTMECAALALSAPEAARLAAGNPRSRPSSSAGSGSVSSPRAAGPVGVPLAGPPTMGTRGLATPGIETPGVVMPAFARVGQAGAGHTSTAPTGTSVTASTATSRLALGFVFAVIVLLVLPRWRLGRLLRGRTPVRSGALFDELQRLHAAAGGSVRHVRLSVSDVLAVPIAFGVLWPEITVPRRALDGLSVDSARALLAHELAHHARRDPLWVALAQVVCTLFVWQPLFRIARRELLLAAELRADDLAIEWTADGLALARCIAEVAGWMRPTAPVAGALAMVRTQNGGELRRRVERALAGPTSARASHLGQLALLIGCGAALAAPSLALVPRRSSDPASARGGAPEVVHPTEAERGNGRGLPSSADAVLGALRLEMQAVELDLAGLRDHADPSIRSRCAELEARGAELEARGAELEARCAESEAAAALRAALDATRADANSAGPRSTPTWTDVVGSTDLQSTPMEETHR